MDDSLYITLLCHMLTRGARTDAKNEPRLATKDSLVTVVLFTSFLLASGSIRAALCD